MPSRPSSSSASAARTGATISNSARAASWVSPRADDGNLAHSLCCALRGKGQFMSALGQKQTFAPQKVMSALPPKADMCGAVADVRYGPKADIVLTGHACDDAAESTL